MLKGKLYDNLTRFNLSCITFLITLCYSQECIHVNIKYISHVCQQSYVACLTLFKTLTNYILPCQLVLFLLVPASVSMV